MKKIKVSVINNYEIRLEEDAKKGDFIDLKDVMEVDTSNIARLIDEAKDKVYEAKLKDVVEKEKLINEQLKEKAVNEIKNENIKLRTELDSLEKSIKAELTLTHNEKVSMLNNEINLLREKIESEKLKTVNEYNDKLNEQKTLINELKNEVINKENNQKILKLKIEKEYTEQINQLIQTNETLKRERSSLTVKNIGESLETWCDNEFNANNLLMPENIVWHKDNDVVKGGKADFIYKVYADNNQNDDEMLTSAILEMKSEDPLAKSKQNIDSILRKLNEDRNNKNIEYAILVSEIDWKDNNDVPIKKVLEYDKMFIVRPPYFITLLNIITAFGLKYKEILLAEKAERIKFKDAEDILDEFEKMKEDILDLSLRYIEQNVEEIIKESINIKKANEKLLDAANKVLETHLITVKNKINSFNINRIIKKVNNL